MTTFEIVYCLGRVVIAYIINKWQQHNPVFFIIQISKFKFRFQVTDFILTVKKQ